MPTTTHGLVLPSCRCLPATLREDGEGAVETFIHCYHVLLPFRVPFPPVLIPTIGFSSHALLLDFPTDFYGWKDGKAV